MVVLAGQVEDLQNHLHGPLLVGQLVDVAVDEVQHLVALGQQHEVTANVDGHRIAHLVRVDVEEQRLVGGGRGVVHADHSLVLLELGIPDQALELRGGGDEHHLVAAENAWTTLALLQLVRLRDMELAVRLLAIPQQVQAA